MDISDEIKQMHNEVQPVKICFEVNSNPNKMVQIADIIND